MTKPKLDECKKIAGPTVWPRAVVTVAAQLASELLPEGVPLQPWVQRRIPDAVVPSCQPQFDVRSSYSFPLREQRGSPIVPPFSLVLTRI